MFETIAIELRIIVDLLCKPFTYHLPKNSICTFFTVHRHKIFEIVTIEFSIVDLLYKLLHRLCITDRKLNFDTDFKLGSRDYKTGQFLRITNRGRFRDFKTGQKDYKSVQNSSNNMRKRRIFNCLVMWIETDEFIRKFITRIEISVNIRNFTKWIEINVNIWNFTNWIKICVNIQQFGMKLMCIFEIVQRGLKSVWIFEILRSGVKLVWLFES